MCDKEHVVEFSRFGRSFQMLVRDGLDLEEVLKLDEALWGAISAPAEVLIPDPVLRKLLEAENDNRITSKELRLAIAWMLKQLPDHAAIVPEFDGKLMLNAINSTDAESQALSSSAKYVLDELKAENKDFITLEQVREFLTNLTAFALNGDGVLTPKAATAAKTMLPEVANIVNDVVAATGGATDVDGTKGLDKATLDTFLAEVPKFLEWYDKGQIPAGKDITDVMTVGADTPALSAIVQANAQKIDRFFQLCEILDFDGRINGHELSPASKVEAFDPAALDVVNNFQDALPIATPNAAGLLPLAPEKTNPALRAWMADFATKVVPKVLGAAAESISKLDWLKIKAAFAPYEAWMASKAGACVEALPVDRLRTYLDCAPLLAEVNELMTRDKAVADIAAGARQVERLILYRANMLRIANNFVNFSELYDVTKPAIFECGKMVIDGRWFEVAFKVDSPAAHSAIGASSQLFLMYVEVNMAPAAPLNVVIPVTGGSKGNLFVGKRGVFYDNNGVDHDAKIVKIQENPVCMAEALLAPFTKLWGIVEGKITSWSGEAEGKLQKNFTTAINTDPSKLAQQPAPAAPPADKKDSKMNGTALMGVGVAVAALGSAFAFISKTLAAMSYTAIIITVIVAILALMLPVSLIALIKLRRQDVSSVLEGCGWGINLRLRLNNKVRRNFTHYGRYPLGAKGTPKSYVLSWILGIILVIAICVSGGFWYRQYENKKAEEKAYKEQHLAELEAAKEADKLEAAEKAAAEKAAAEKAAAEKAAAEKAAAEKAAAPEAAK